MRARESTLRRPDLLNVDVGVPQWQWPAITVPEKSGWSASRTWALPFWS